MLADEKYKPLKDYLEKTHNANFFGVLQTIYDLGFDHGLNVGFDKAKELNAPEEGEENLKSYA